MARLHQAGHRVAIATNQSGLAKGLFDLETLNRIHNKMLTRLREAGGQIDLLMFCPHAEDAAPCRKPNPGMLIEIAQRLAADPAHTIVVGDALRDITAARAMGARPILVRTGKGARTSAESRADLGSVNIYDDLAEFVDEFLTSDGEDN